jgi:hypothetical protein
MIMNPFTRNEKVAVVTTTGLGAFLGAVGSMSSQPVFGVLSTMFVGFMFMIAVT